MSVKQIEEMITHFTQILQLNSIVIEVVVGTKINFPMNILQIYHPNIHIYMRHYAALPVQSLFFREEHHLSREQDLGVDRGCGK